MNLRYYTLIGSLSALVAGSALLAPARAMASEQGVEELTRGPVHEAFAATVSFDPEPGMFVRTAPPAIIEEVPPEQRLEGDNVSWIPGYWGWDGEQNDFIWISGVWRNLPPGRQWVPGYWGEADSQWQWTSGYWADEAAEEVAYLPKPPKSIESGPNVEAPSRNHIWISGTWVDRDDRYAWRPGYWEPGQENWTWIPAHYQWTRRGYVFIDGYWDYAVARRGVVFAPVRFQRGYHDQPNFTYTPLMVISLNVFANHLFVRPSYGHYYFGDYYASRYRNEGYYSSFSYRSGRRGYDPIYAQSRWEHRDDRGWEQARRDNYEYYRDNRDARPPQTWAAMQSRPVDRRGGKRDNYQFAAPLNQYAGNPTGGQRFATVDPESRSRIVEQRQQVREFSKGRQQLESRPIVQAPKGAEKALRVNREKIVKSPVAAKRAGQLSGNDAPPQRHELKATDPRGGRNPGPAGKAANPAEAMKQARQPDAAARGDHPQPVDKRGGNTGTEANSRQNRAPAPKNTAQPQARPGPKVNENKIAKPGTDPRARITEAAQPGKQAVPPERQSQQRQNAAPQSAGKPEPKDVRQTQPQAQSRQNPQPERTAKPKNQPQPRQNAQPQPARQPQPERTAKPKNQPQPRQNAQPPPARQPQPQPQRTAEPQRQQRVQPQQPNRQPSPTGPVKPGSRKNQTEEDSDPRNSR